jgi:thioredoxin 2
MAGATDVRVISCPACGAANRLPAGPVPGGRRPICGRCRTPLDARAAPLTVTDASFARDVEQSPLPVLLDLWAPWCGPCRTMAPILDGLAAELAGAVRVAKVDVDDNPSTARRFDAQSIPTLLVLRGGREVDRIVGAVPRAEIVRRLQQAGIL